MKKLLLNHPALKGLLMLLTILFAMPQAALADDDPQQPKPTYKLTSGDGIVSFYMKGEHYPIEVTEAPEGALITVSPEFEKIPAGKYATGEYTSEQVTVTPALDEDTGLPTNTGDGQFTMPAMAVTVSAVLADQGEYLVDLLNQTTQVVPESIWTLLYSLDYSNEDPESPHYNNSDEDGNRYLDLNLDGENDLLVKEDVDETTQVTTYSLVRLTGADNLKNCRFAVSYIHPYPYNSVFFKLKPVTVKADKQKKYAHADDPELTATIEGLADDDKQKAGIIAYTISRAEGEKTGTYDITPSGDAEQGNYSVTFESAKLYILHAPSPYGVWVNELAVTADNRLDILGDGDKTNKKAPSVQYFEVGNVLVLTNATVETIESEGDLEVYMAPESKNTVGSITRGINDPQDPDENVAQTRSLGWEAPVVGGKTSLHKNDGKLSLTSDHNFYGNMTFPHLTGQTTISNYSEIVTGGRLITFDAAGNVIAAPASVSTPQEIAAVRADATPVTRKMDVGASAIADAVTKADVATGTNVTVNLGLSGGFSESGAAKTNFAVVTGGMADPGLGTATGNIVAPSGAIHMQNYDQPGGDAMKKDEKGNDALSFKGEPAAKPVYRLYNPNSGEHFYTMTPTEADALTAAGWNSEGDCYVGISSGATSSAAVSADFPSGAAIVVPAGKTEIIVESAAKGNAELGAVISASFSDLPSLYLEEVDEDPGLTEAIDDDEIIFVIDGDILKKYNGKDEQVTIPDGLKKIASSAFKDNKTLNEVILPTTIETIGQNAFDGCSNLKKVIRSQESQLKKISSYAFKNCTSLTDFDLSNVKSIWKTAFEGCTNFDLTKNNGGSAIDPNNIFVPVAGKVVVDPDGRKITSLTVNTSEPITVEFSVKIDENGNFYSRGDGDNAEEESELLIYNIQITPQKIYACNSIAEVTGGEYVGLEYIQEQLPGQKVTGDDADLPKPGDVNGDDVVNAVDVVMTNNHIKGIYSSLFCKSAANLKADDTIDQADIDEMVKQILKQK